ncbi:MAG: CysB family HTH-type transcriptional regulator [Moraxellaceae bacterium]|nr:CysB family HTH-type transcriptional regulator [Moraxellaceae bacterium]
MNFQQLRIVRETVRQGFNLTEVANALYTSQSGVSKHLKDLEEELGIELFHRKGKRLLGLTEPGRELLSVVERMLLDAHNIRQLADEFSKRDQGRLVVATTHTQARYVLPPVVARFKAAYPRVQLVLHQASPAEIVQQLLSGEADIGIATESLDGVSGLISFPYYSWQHTVIVPEGHSLADDPALSLPALARFPVVTYHEGFTGRTRIDEAFAAAGLHPDVVMTALDADVIKTYVELGLGVGIIAAMAFSPARDKGLVALDAMHLFAPNTTRLAVRNGHYLRGFAYRFIELCAPALEEEIIRGEVRKAVGE